MKPMIDIDHLHYHDKNSKCARYITENNEIISIKAFKGWWWIIYKETGCYTRRRTLNSVETNFDEAYRTAVDRVGRLREIDNDEDPLLLYTENDYGYI